MEKATLPRACIAVPLPPEAEARLRDACAIDLVTGRDLPAALAAAEGVLIINNVPVNDALFDAAPNLRVVSGFGVGYNNVDLEAATRRGVLICNTPGVLNDAVADLTMGLILAFARRIPENDAFVHARQWGTTPLPPLGFDLRGKTLGIIGFGRIGLAVAQRARPFGLQVIFYDVFDGSPPGFEDCTPCALADVLSRSDIVSIHTNLTPETHHLISREEFALMKPTAILVNTSRGPVVDQAALVEALTMGKIAGAALDVLEQEPPAPDEPLLGLPNVIALPHVGTATHETRAAMLDLAVTNLIEALSGRVPPACVNPEVLPLALQRRPATPRLRRPMRENTAKSAWKEGRVTHGAWLSVPSSVTAEAMAHQGFDWLCIDMQHGLIDYPAALAMLQAINSTPTPPFVRVPWNEPGIIGKMLDAGALGVIIPMVNSPEEARAAVAACRYYPDGARSFGPTRLGYAYGADLLPQRQRAVACIPMIETKQAVAQLDAILDVPGIDAVYVGPADLSITLDLPPGMANEGAFEEARVRIADACLARGITPGIHANAGLAEKHAAAGYRMITVSGDLGAMTQQAAADLKRARGTATEAAQPIYR